MGSPSYMSPEQLRESKSVDARADIWALGVILYELIGGKLPYAAESLPETIVLILSNTPVPLSVHRPEVPPALEQAIMRCLCSDREERYATVADLASALAPFAGDPQAAALSVAKISRVLGHPSQPPVLSMPPPSVALDKTLAVGAVVQTQSGVAGSIAPPPKSRTVLLVGACALLVVVGLGVFASTRAHSEARGAASATSIAEAPRPPPSALPAATAEASSSIPSAVEAPATAPSQSAAPKGKPPKPIASAIAAPSSSAEQKNPLQMGIK
jgi:serine/threonine protein kinase